MSIQTTALKYGWSIVAGAVLTGATIFTADSTLKYITQRDAIQVILGTVERCLATQTGTNVDGTAIYAVAPPSFVRSWVSTNGLTGTNFAWVTNQVTNSISWYTDRAMMVALDAKIFALIPYYADANTVYDGATNISMLTVTGLFASLQIGDGTNKFTSIPAIGTNAATFGPWAQLNYRAAWEERYKVLNSMKIPKVNLYATIFDVTNKYKTGSATVTNDALDEYDLTKLEAAVAEAKTDAASDFLGSDVIVNDAGVIGAWSEVYASSSIYPPYRNTAIASLFRRVQTLTYRIVVFNTQSLCSVSSIKIDVLTAQACWYPSLPYYNGNGDFPVEGRNTISQTAPAGVSVLSLTVGDDTFPLPSWDGQALYNLNYTLGGGYKVTGMECVVVYTNAISASMSNIFNYCTNKYW